MKIERGDWVRSVKDRKRRGFVVSVESKGWADVRWQGTAKAKNVSKKSLRHANPPAVLYLEGNLDSKLHSRRTGMAALCAWCDANNVDFACKTIHCLEDIKIIANSLPRAPVFVHVACHGGPDPKDDTGRKAGAFLRFTPQTGQGQRVYISDPKTAAAFNCLVKKGVRDLFLDACFAGRLERDIDAFREAAKFRFVAAIPRSIADFESLIVGPCLYHALLNCGLSFNNAVGKVVKAVKVLGIKGAPGRKQALIRVFPET